MLGNQIRRGVLSVLIAMTVSAFLATPAAAWWQKDWTYRKPVAIDLSPSGVNVSGPVGRTLVLVRLHSGNFTFIDALDNGADLRFVDTDDKTPLPYHIESFDPKNGLANVWVSVQALNGGEKKSIWLYFGNKTAPAGSDVKASFDPDYTAVYHFGEGAEDEVMIAVIAREGVQLDPAQLIGWLIPQMPYFMVPRYVELFDEFPRTPTNKVQKFMLRSRGVTSSTWDREAAGIVVKRG